MADKLLKSIKFPTLPDRYVIGDSTLTEEGAAAEAKAVGEALATKADTSGTYEDLIVGGAEQLMADGYETDKEPYLFRATGGSADVGNREYLDKIVGGTVAWNQLVSASATSVTVQSGHKYIAKIGGAWSVAASSGSTISVTGGSDILIDLTALFNPTIADYIYSIEQAHAGDGVAWFRKLFPKPYYAYNAGELKSVNTSAHNTVGFNQWDEEWEDGAYDISTGRKVTSDANIRSKNLIKILPNATYFVKSPYTYGLRVVAYDADGEFLNDLSYKNNATFISPNNCGYITFFTNGADEVTAYNGGVCINLSDQSRNGEYEPYTKHTYPLDSSLTLRGIPKLVDGKLAFDGDVYLPSGEVQRRYGIVDLGTLTWAYNTPSGNMYSDGGISNRKIEGLAISSAYPIHRPELGGVSGLTDDKEIAFQYNLPTRIIVRDTAYTDAASFKAAMSGVYLVYELTTPTTETAEGYEQYQICDPSGTEEFVTTGIVPVGHETRYPHDLKKKIETAPDSPSADGTYLMKRSGGKNTYMALPSTPSANGAYVLTVTVSGGTASYSWTAKE